MATDRFPEDSVSALLPFDGERAESRVFVDDLPECDVFRVAPPILDLLHIVPYHYDNTLRRLALNLRHCLCSCCARSSYGHEAASSGFDDGLSLRCKLLRVSIRVCRIDFHDIVDGRFGLSVEPLNRLSTGCAAREHCQGHCVGSFHGSSSLSRRAG